MVDRKRMRILLLLYKIEECEVEPKRERKRVSVSLCDYDKCVMRNMNTCIICRIYAIRISTSIYLSIASMSVYLFILVDQSDTSSISSLSHDSTKQVINHL